MTELVALIEAVKTGDLAQVVSLVKANPALASGRLESGESPIMAGLYRGQRDVVAALIAAGAEVDVFAAAATGRLDDLRRTMKAPGTIGSLAYDGWTPLHLAAFFGHVEAARALVAAGADVNAVSANSLANTPLHAAAAGKHPAVALLLLEHGAKSDLADAGGYTPLQIAAQNQLQTVVDEMTDRTRRDRPSVLPSARTSAGTAGGSG